MPFSTRLGLFVLIAIAGCVAWQWNTTLDSAREATDLAVRQFQDDVGVAPRLRQASLTQCYWPLVWPTVLVLLAAVLFWDDLERLCKHDD